MSRKNRVLSLSHSLGITVVATIVAILPLSAPCSAESVAVPVAAQGADIQNVDRPLRGETKAAVEKRFGQPKQWGDAVGEPPITAWQYDNFTVYFENDRVIHTVLNHHK